MSRIRWTGVVLGVAITVVLGTALLAFVSLVLDPFLISLTSTGPVSGATSVTATEERVRGLLLLVSTISAVFLALLVGGLVVSRFATSYAGLNGAVMGIVIAAAPFLWLLGSIVFVFLEPTASPDDAITRSESLRMLGAALVAYSVVSPVFILAGFLAGRIGRRFGQGNIGV